MLDVISPSQRPDRRCDILVVGAGAAGLLAALAARGALGADGRRRRPPRDAPDVVVLNNVARIGLKILVSGGGRCNVTNAFVDEHDYDTDAPHLVRRILRGFPPDSIRTFFESRGCPLYEEPLGKVFPRSNRARDVLDVLLEAVREASIPMIAPAVVSSVEPADGGLAVAVSDRRPWFARRVIIATGGKSLPKTGSRGFGFGLLARLGHGVLPTVPGLTSLVLKPTSPVRGLAGLTVPAVLTAARSGTAAEERVGKKFRPLARAAGSMLISHKGATGPAPFDVSGPCGRALEGGATIELRADFWSLTCPEGAWGPYLALPKPPGASLASRDVPRPPSRVMFEAQIHSVLARRDRSVGNALAERLPRNLLHGLLRQAGIDPTLPVKQLDGGMRRGLWLALTQTDLHLDSCEGYAKAEVTSGGVSLRELFPATLESRIREHIFCCGEVIDATGRLGGFNFQWAWSSGFAAGLGAAKTLVAE